MYVYIYIYRYVYIYIYIYILSSSRKRPDHFFYGFHRRDSRGLVAAGNQQKTNDGNHKKAFLATTETINKPTTETIKNVFLPRRKP